MFRSRPAHTQRIVVTEQLMRMSEADDILSSSSGFGARVSLTRRVFVVTDIDSLSGEYEDITTNQLSSLGSCSRRQLYR